MGQHPRLYELDKFKSALPLYKPWSVIPNLWRRHKIKNELSEEKQRTLENSRVKWLNNLDTE